MEFFKTRYLSLIFLLLLPILGSALSVTLLNDWSFENVFAHSILEVLGALAALVILASIIVVRSSLNLERHEIAWVLAALAAMGSLDLFHASAPFGTEVVWFATSANLAGGLLYACLWARPVGEKIYNSLPFWGVLLTIILVPTIFVGSDVMPPMVEDGTYSTFAKSLNVLAGIGFFSAFIYFIMRFRRTGERDYIILAAHSFSFSLACILFAFSAPWDVTWWWWHILRFASYISLVLLCTGARIQGLSDTLLLLGRHAPGNVPRTNKPGHAYLSIGAGALTSIIALVVIWGWYVQNTALIQINPNFAPMQLNTALCFLLCGIGLIAVNLQWWRVATISGAVAAVFSFLTLLQYIFGIQLGIDEMFMDGYVMVKTSHPGRMAPNTAVCFVLIGSALVLYSQKNKGQLIHNSVEIIGLFALGLAALAIVGYIVGQENGYAWGALTRMALHTSIGFVLLSVGGLALCWRQNTQAIASVPLWFPAILCFGVLVFDMIYAEGLSAGVAYVPLVFCSLAFYQSRSTFVFAGLASILVLLGYYATSTAAYNTEFEIINRLLSIMAIWLTAVFIHLLKTTQQRMFESDEALKLGWRGAGDGMWDWNVLTNEVSYSDKFKELLGYKPNEFGGQFKEWVDRLHKDDKHNVLETLKSHLNKGTPFETEHRLQTQSGEWRWFVSKGQALWDAQGSPTRMAGSLGDITYRKEAELQLRLLRLSVDHSKDLMLITNTDPENPTIVFANQASKRICGYTPQELIGQTTKILEGPKTNPEVLEAKKTAIRNDDAFTGEMLNYAKDKREYWIQVNMVPVKDQHGFTTHFASIKRDITANKNAQIERESLISALKTSNRELAEFAYVASHDLKAPLRVIQNVSQWLEEDLFEHFNPETLENMELLRNRVMRMEKLLDDLLEYSRIGHKMDESYSETVTGDALLKDVIMLLELPEKFSVTLSPELKTIKINRMPLENIFLNLISNSIKHHHKETGTIEVGVQDLGSTYCFTVKDDGPGIAPQYHEKIFKMFQTLRPRDRVEGSGMGLPMVRKNIEHFGGSISVESREGQGAIFRFLWPKKQRNAEKSDNFG